MALRSKGTMLAATEADRGAVVWQSCHSGAPNGYRLCDKLASSGDAYDSTASEKALSGRGGIGGALRGRAMGDRQTAKAV